VKEANWLLPEIPAGGLDVEVKLRSAQPPLPAKLFAADGAPAKVQLKTPAFGVAAGQACVCYAGDRVLGGGWITGADNTGVMLAA
jgi:tRNA-specific 2-thiouridylase